MAWSYSGDPSSSPKDAVRFLIQDTNPASPIVQDEEINWVLTNEMNVWMAAAAICDTLIGRGGAVKMKKVDGLMIAYDRAFYTALALGLRARGMNYQVPYAGGISVADKEALEADPDWIRPSILRGLDDNPLAPSPATPPANPLTSV